ncbi:unnamed protein product [Vitrella brassicaformis CCMP3155]|uniref:Transmembrane protein n=2 Tax=Vitrella brassicaformis TaxID=1169539 RepID=A0A0G4EY71_VITBC|nr:unnamed protein product [Vitrella brassicaformis CCMP3155]|mmetsp:Transcript_44613/g.110976  ORF Transcript_44613/g.110976 Transcript_44613/m.110976 type:complete len:355 (+) Transcript_44613:47-1111(+)|eukprot:CEM04290.1 unnamed protein product [Vitrella brassicaformis CCMP3155]
MPVTDTDLESEGRLPLTHPPESAESDSERGQASSPLASSSLGMEAFSLRRDEDDTERDRSLLSTSPTSREATARWFYWRGGKLRVSRAAYQIMTGILFHILLIVVVETVFFFTYVTRQEMLSFGRNINTTGYSAAKTSVEELQQTPTGKQLLWTAHVALTNPNKRQEIAQEIVLQIEVLRRARLVLENAPIPWEKLNITKEEAHDMLEKDDQAAQNVIQLLHNVTASHSNDFDVYLQKYVQGKRDKAIEQRHRRMAANRSLVFRAIEFNVCVALLVLAWVFGTPLYLSDARLKDLRWNAILRDNAILMFLLALFEFAFFNFFVSRFKVASNAETIDALVETTLDYLKNLKVEKP